MSRTSIHSSARTIMAAICVSACADTPTRVVEPIAPNADVVKFFPDTASAEQARRELGSNRKDG